MAPIKRAVTCFQLKSPDLNRFLMFSSNLRIAENRTDRFTQSANQVYIKRAASSQIEDTGKLGGIFRTPQQQAAMLEDSPATPPLGAADDLLALQDNVPRIATTETEELTLCTGIVAPAKGHRVDAFLGQSGDDSRVNQFVNSRRSLR